MNYWYSARQNEIFLDLDSRKALYRAMKIVRVLPAVKRLWHFPTGRAGHSHVIVEIKQSRNWDARHRAEVALWMGSDKLRACYVFQRQSKCSRNADLLVTNRKYHRDPDAVCECVGKHKDKTVTDKCPALQQFLGAYRSVDWFPRAGRVRMKMIRIPVGRVPLKLIRGWKRAR